MWNKKRILLKKKKNIIILKGIIVKSLFFSPLFSQTPFRKPLNHPFLEEKKKAANKQNFLTKPVESQIKDTQIVVKAF